MADSVAIWGQQASLIQQTDSHDMSVMQAETWHKQLSRNTQGRHFGSLIQFTWNDNTSREPPRQMREVLDNSVLLQHDWVLCLLCMTEVLIKMRAYSECTCWWLSIPSTTKDSQHLALDHNAMNIAVYELGRPIGHRGTISILWLILPMKVTQVLLNHC